VLPRAANDDFLETHGVNGRLQCRLQSRTGHTG
jgi:hypothetical protein